MSQGMNEFLSQYYQTAPQVQPSAEEVQRAAQIDFFAKTAAANGIDLEALNETQINWLWGQIFPAAEKTAEAQPAKTAESKEEKKEEAKKDEEEKKAAAEFNQKKEAMAKIAEADYLGRVMAHSLWNEYTKIAAAHATEQAKQAEAAKAAESKEEKKEEKEEGKESLRDRLMAAASKKEEKKEEEKKASASDFDVKAAELAVQKIAASNQWDVQQGVERLNAVLTLGARESTKVASAPNFEVGLDIRALELLEMAGYPVEWK